MDIEIKIDRVEKLFRRLKCKHDEILIILKDCIERREADEEAERIRIINVNKKIEDRKKAAEEKERIHHYKPVRFRKPLPLLEDRRQYTRFCIKCKEYYRTFAKYGEVCDGCKIKGVSDGVPDYLIKKVIKI